MYSIYYHRVMNIYIYKYDFGHFIHPNTKVGVEMSLNIYVTSMTWKQGSEMGKTERCI